MLQSAPENLLDQSAFGLDVIHIEVIRNYMRTKRTEGVTLTSIEPLKLDVLMVLRLRMGVVGAIRLVARGPHSTERRTKASRWYAYRSKLVAARNSLNRCTSAGLRPSCRRLLLQLLRLRNGVYMNVEVLMQKIYRKYNLLFTMSAAQHSLYNTVSVTCENIYIYIANGSKQI